MYIQGLSQSRLNTADHAISLVASATAAAYSCSGCPPYNPSARTSIENTVSNGTSTVAAGIKEIIYLTFILEEFELGVVFIRLMISKNYL
jgi:hypothetical protein